MIFFSIIIATHNRLTYLQECLDSVFNQTYRNYEVIIAHSGFTDGTREYVSSLIAKGLPVIYKACQEKGSASQRNEGMEQAKGDWFVFPDDDVVLKNNYLDEFAKTINCHSNLGGVSARIENQYFVPLSKPVRLILRLSGVPFSSNIEGKVVGPALNFLPSADGPSEEEVDWMPVGACTYSKEAFEWAGGFPKQFKNYSFAEDVALSLKIKKKYKLVLNRKAILFHYDLGAKSHKNLGDLAEMQVVNRKFILKNILNSESDMKIFQLYLWSVTNALVAAVNGNIGVSGLIKMVAGYTKGIFK